MLSALTKQMSDGAHLTDAQVFDAVAELIAERATTEVKAAFLAALARKGETIQEIAAFARELRAKSISPPLDAETRSRQILDVCGTGGDRLNTFNISTAAALVVASGGVSVAKHGNRAITSQAGSADVLEALGIKIDLTPSQAAASLRDHHFAFFFAPHYHPAFQQIGAARRLCGERGQRTIFNYLGPLLNPVSLTLQLMGVPSPELCAPIAAALQALGLRRGMVVCGSVIDSGKMRHLDELSTLGESVVAEFYHGRAISVSTLSPEHFPIQSATLADLAGGNRDANAEIIRRILRGDERGPKRDAVLLNSAAALFIAERARTLDDGWHVAAELIDSGRAAQKLSDLQAFCEK